ncbi:hypothetical protein KBD61_03485 [Patescibacteria group bacterium]|nr:hypothetical protein [Patescibacteria group bacterium]MBP9710059.1 hypothetical protein [Patescibacteria group bacterium]
MYENFANNETNIKSFEELSLTELTWKKQAPNKPAHIKRSCEQLVRIRGKTFLLLGTEDTEEGLDTKGCTSIERIFRILHPNSPRESLALLFGELTISGYPHHKSQEARTFIQKPGDEPLLRDGIGVQLWEKMVDLLATDAGRLHKTVHHKITMEPGMTTKTPLTTQRWLELFGPILKKRGYLQTSDTTWEKDYRPLPETKLQALSTP